MFSPSQMTAFRCFAMTAKIALMTKRTGTNSTTGRCRLPLSAGRSPREGRNQRAWGGGGYRLPVACAPCVLFPSSTLSTLLAFPALPLLAGKVTVHWFSFLVKLNQWIVTASVGLGVPVEWVQLESGMGKITHS
jgi:hypothetical protein